MNPIVKLCRHQPEIAVRLVQSGCDGGQLVDWRNVRLVIEPGKCCEVELTEWDLYGCWPGYTANTCRCKPFQPALVYPAFTLDPKGRVVFRFDELMWSNPPGRYLARVEYMGCTPITEFEIDYCNQPFLIDQVVVQSTDCSQGDC